MQNTTSQTFFKWLGSASGKFYNSHKAWQEAPNWVKESYKLEVENRSGDIDTVFSGAVKGLIEAGLEYTKTNPLDAAKMGKDLATSVGISPEHGTAFASGFLETAKLS